MTITFINVYQAVIWILVTIISMFVYIQFVRPHLVKRIGLESIASRISTLSRIWVWIKTRWDVVVAGFIVTLPSLWNGFLDFIIFLSLHATELLPALQGIDLSDLLMPKWLETFIRLGAPMAPIVRSWLLANAGEGE